MNRLSPSRLLKRVGKVFAKPPVAAPVINKPQTFRVSMPDLFSQKPTGSKHAIKRNKARRRKDIRKRQRKEMKRRFHASDRRRRS